MDDLFQNRYRIPSNRLKGWDYSNDGLYFITLVTAGRRQLFGKIRNGEMVLNEIGQLVYDAFFKSFEIRRELSLDAFILMPDHLHAIIILDSMCRDARCRDARPCVSTTTTTQPQLHRQPQSISSFVAGFKSSTVKIIDDWIDKNNIKMPKFNRNNPLWQSNYYDRIIRNETEYQNIYNYILENPLKWNNSEL